MVVPPACLSFDDTLRRLPQAKTLGWREDSREPSRAASVPASAGLGEASPGRFEFGDPPTQPSRKAGRGQDLQSSHSWAVRDPHLDRSRGLALPLARDWAVQSMRTEREFPAFPPTTAVAPLGKEGIGGDGTGRPGVAFAGILKRRDDETGRAALGLGDLSSFHTSVRAHLGGAERQLA